VSGALISWGEHSETQQASDLFTIFKK